MKEYTIYFRHGNCKPYTLDTYKTIDGAKAKLNDIISLEIERKRPFFIDNDFYNNKYNFGSKLFYICIMEREVTEWKKFSENENREIIKNKILYFSNFK